MEKIKKMKEKIKGKQEKKEKLTKKKEKWIGKKGERWKGEGGNSNKEQPFKHRDPEINSRDQKGEQEWGKKIKCRLFLLAYAKQMPFSICS